MISKICKQHFHTLKNTRYDMTIQSKIIIQNSVLKINAHVENQGFKSPLKAWKGVERRHEAAKAYCIILVKLYFNVIHFKREQTV